VHLEKARKAEPRNSTILALFATTTLANFGWGAYEKLLSELANADPKTPEAKLFVGYALLPANHARAVALMEEAVEEDGSPLARVLLANARMRHSLDTQNIELMKQALEDLSGASSWSPHAIRVMVATVEIHSAAAKLYRHAGDTGGEERQFNLATKAIQQLERVHPRNPRALRARLEFLIEQGRTDTALDLARQVSQEVPGQRLEEVTAHLLALKGQYREAMLFARSFKSDSIMRTIHFLAAIEVSDALDEAKASAAEISGKTPSHINEVFTGVLLNQMLGDTNQSIHLARGFLANQGILGRAAMPSSALRVIRYLAAEIHEVDLLKDATTGHALALSHHFVGLGHLARGDRATAKAHFQSSMDGIPVVSPAREISKHILGRMAADRNWPPTIPTNIQGKVAPVASQDAPDQIQTASEA
jgi:tetratricopeptide (TPR) repeat protein